MPTREEALAERTYKQEGLEVEKRVFYTLHGEGKSPSAKKYRITETAKQLRCYSRWSWTSGC